MKTLGRLGFVNTSGVDVHRSSVIHGEVVTHRWDAGYHPSTLSYPIHSKLER